VWRLHRNTSVRNETFSEHSYRRRCSALGTGKVQAGSR